MSALENQIRGAIEVKELAFAKLNLTLDVGDKREDGFHDITSVMQGIALYDNVTVRVVPLEEWEMYGVDTAVNAVTELRSYHSTQNRGLPRGRRNTAVKAADAFFAFTGITGFRAEISLEKHIPVGAGMAGGSADAAAVLRALNRAFNTNLSFEFLRAIGATVGSDVPFCIEGGTALAMGRGEILQQLPDFPNCEIVIVKPDFSVSTAELFAAIDRVKIRSRPDTKGILDAINEGNLNLAVRYLYNVFEDALPTPQAAEVAAIREKLLDCGALGAVMTGTGSAVFGLFSEGSAEAADKLRSTYKSVFVC